MKLVNKNKQRQIKLTLPNGEILFAEPYSFVEFEDKYTPFVTRFQNAFGFDLIDSDRKSGISRSKGWGERSKELEEIKERKEEETQEESEQPEKEPVEVKKEEFEQPKEESVEVKKEEPAKKPQGRARKR